MHGLSKVTYSPSLLNMPMASFVGWPSSSKNFSCAMLSNSLDRWQATWVTNTYKGQCSVDKENIVAHVCRFRTLRRWWSWRGMGIHYSSTSTFWFRVGCKDWNALIFLIFSTIWEVVLPRTHGTRFAYFSSKASMLWMHTELKTGQRDGHEMRLEHVHELEAMYCSKCYTYGTNGTVLCIYRRYVDVRQ